MRRALVFPCLLSMLSMLAGCSVLPGPKPGDPAYAPVEAPVMPPATANRGGIYRPDSGVSLFADDRARGVGDVLTITLSERTVSSKSAGSDISKESSIDLNAGPVLGRGVTFNGYTMETGIEHNREFEGSASADQRNQLQGSIAVTVARVLPNGLLEVRGEKWLTLNRGEEFIRLRGLVRPADINPDNTIASTKVADVRIAYSGTGELAESNRQGWLSRFFTSEYWPF